ncbi:MAG: OmpA family protein [Bacteroidales bacterium]|nr:OmpA family protein [Bacteroidales bacterium]
MKKLFVVLASVLFVSLSANAQNEFYPGWYLGAQGGAVYTTSNNWSIGHFQHLSPNAAINVGYDFTPVFGLRANLSGPMANFPNGTEIGKLNYAQLALDATVDICNIFKYKETRFLSPYIFLGAGAAYRFAANNTAACITPAVRAGLGFDFRFSDLVGLSLEFQDNGLSNKFNTLDDNEFYGGEILHIKRPFKWDDNFAALVGLKFNIGSVKKKAAAKAAAEQAAAIAAAKAAAERAEAERLAAEKAEAERLAAEQAEAERLAAEKAAAEKAAAEAAAAARAAARASEENIYFDLDRSVIKKSEQAKVDAIIELLNNYPEAQVTVSGYADKETGYPKYNMKLSQKRAERVAKALEDAGIAAERITVNYYGDTVRVSDVRKENRVAIVVTR